MRRAVPAALALAALACGQQQIGADLSVRAVFSAAPSVGCVTLSIAGATRTVSQSFPTSSGTSPSFVLRRVPTGDVVVSGSAHDAPCGDLTTQHPTWFAGPVLQTLAPGGERHPRAVLPPQRGSDGDRAIRRRSGGPGRFLPARFRGRCDPHGRAE